MPDRFFALHAQICDTSALCWSTGEQQFGTKAIVSRRNFRLQFASCWSIGEQEFGTILFLGEAYAFSLTLLRGLFLSGQRFPPRRRTAVTKHWRGPMRHELCLSSCRSSFLPSSLQRWAEAASLLLGVCGRYSTLQLFPLCSAPTAPSQH